MITVSTRNEYPDLGRNLIQSDLGKKVLRTKPFELDDRLNYTFMVNSIDEAFTLMWVSATSAVVSKANVYYYVCKEAMSAWLTVDEFQLSVHKAKSIIHYIHYGLPC